MPQRKDDPIGPPMTLWDNLFLAFVFAIVISPASFVMVMISIWMIRGHG